MTGALYGHYPQILLGAFLPELKSTQKTKDTSVTHEDKTSQEFDVQVKITYISEESRPDSNYHFFAYKVSITNKSAHEAQLMSRHWVITDGFGQTEEVRGAGVVGQQPKIKPGETFQYESACPLNTSFGTMRGTYHLVDHLGEQFNITIPEFYLIAPSALH